MTTTTEELTPEQRLEVRRTLLQSIGEIGRGLKLAGLLLKQGKFSSAKETITGTEAMLILHEGMAQLLLKENQRLRATLLDIDSKLTERAVTFSGTSLRMGEDAMRPKSERQDPDLTSEDIIRYAAYAAESNIINHLVRNMIRKAGAE